MIIEEFGVATCSSCETQLSLTEMLEKYGEQKSPEDESIEESHSYCSECEFTEQKSVIPVGKGNYLCLSCQTVHNRVCRCDYCNEKITGDSEGTYLSGCLLCDGVDMSD